jgi:transposase
MKYLGIDLHSNRFTCCCIPEDGSKDKFTFNIDPESLNNFYRLLSLDMYVMIEASTNTFKFVELIREKVKAVYVANTHKLKLISMVNKKTDNIDAEKLAIFLKMQIKGEEELIKPVYIPNSTIQDLRSLFTSYKFVRKQIVGVKNRIHSILKQNLYPFTKEYIFGERHINLIKKLSIDEAMNFQVKFFFNELEYLEKNIKDIEEKIYLLGREYIKEIDILTSMKGISVMTAIAIIADIASIERFPNSKHFTSYLRSAPGVDSSNETTRIKKTTKFGRKLSVTLLTQSLNHFRDSNPKLKRWHDKAIPAHNKSKGKIRMALCRRVFAEIYQMLKKEEYHYFRNKRLHKKKMDEYYKFLQNNGVFFEKSA